MPKVTIRPVDLAGAPVAASVTISLEEADGRGQGAFRTSAGVVLEPETAYAIDPADPASGQIELTETADITPASVYVMSARGVQPRRFVVGAEPANLGDLIAAYADAQEAGA